MIQAFIKMFKVWRALAKLERAKENRRRMEKGLEPIYTCGEECSMFWKDTVPNTFFRAFCPCCTPEFWDQCCQFDFSDSWFWRLFLPGTFENQFLRSIVTFVFGVVLVLILWSYLILQMVMALKDAFLSTAPFALILPVGMALSPSIRCMVFLVLPGIFSSQGRAVLLAFIVIQIMNGPARNATNNVRVVSDSYMCAREKVATFGRNVMSEVGNPLASVRGSIKDLFTRVEHFVDKITAAFRALYDVTNVIIHTLIAIAKWLADIVKNCNERMGTPYKRCISMADNAIADCRDRMGILKGVCQVVKVMHPLCQVARTGELLCILPNLVKENVYNPVKEKLTDFSDKFNKFFYVNVHLTHELSYSVNQSQSLSDVKKEVMKEIRSRVDVFVPVLDISNMFLYSFVILIVLRAFRYKSQYLTKDYFDNYYITTYVIEIDDRRLDMGKESILPLKWKECSRYISPLSWRMVQGEKVKFFIGCVLLNATVVQASFFMLIDYGLYFILETVNKIIHDVTMNLDLPGKMHANVQGRGMAATMFKDMIDSFDRLSYAGPSIDTMSCVPVPLKPDLDQYRMIGVNLFLCFLLLLCEAYGLRLRRAVCAYYYPGREKQRAVYLYNEIVRRRGNILKFIRRQLRRKGMSGKDRAMNIFERIALYCPILLRMAQILGFQRKYCLCCGEAGSLDDFEKFRHCSTAGCTGVYCQDCYEEINNMCTVCLKPIEYGDMSDMSDERDSSDEEQDDEYEEVEGEVRVKRKKQKEIRRKKPKTYHVQRMTRVYEGLEYEDIPEDETEGEVEVIEEEEEVVEKITVLKKKERTKEIEDYDMDYQNQTDDDQDDDVEILKPRAPFRDVEKQRTNDKVTDDIFLNNTEDIV